MLRVDDPLDKALAGGVDELAAVEQCPKGALPALDVRDMEDVFEVDFANDAFEAVFVSDAFEADFVMDAFEADFNKDALEADFVNDAFELERATEAFELDRDMVDALEPDLAREAGLACAF